MSANIEPTTRYKTILTSQDIVISQPNTGERRQITFTGFQIDFSVLILISVVTQIGVEGYFVTEQYFQTCTDYRLVTLNRLPVPTTFIMNELGQTCVNVNGTIYAVLPQSQVLQ